MKGQSPSPGRGYKPLSDSGRGGTPPNTRKGSVPFVTSDKGRISTGYTSSKETTPPRGGGRLIEGQELRGYVQSGRRDLPTPTDTTVSPTGPKIRRSAGPRG